MSLSENIPVLSAQAVAPLIQRLRTALRDWGAPRCPSPQQYWSDTSPTVGWWKAL
ncbi:hypothetical protein ACEWX3_26350 [Mycobacterium sp. G7A2]|uniref:hypothetical protein n=1 Tax=Mycobacterium sp. G7A2 TaxID=3317307 RepID=UPI0035A8255D